jgi:hypothetical protein
MSGSRKRAEPRDAERAGLPRTARASSLGRTQAEQTTPPCLRPRTEVRVSKEKHPLLAAPARPLVQRPDFELRSALTLRSSGRAKARRLPLR